MIKKEGLLGNLDGNKQTYQKMSLEKMEEFLNKLPDMPPRGVPVIFTDARESERLDALFNKDEAKLHQMHMEDLRTYRNNRKKLYRSILESHGKEIMLDCIYLNVNFRKKHGENEWVTERKDVVNSEYSYLYYTKEVHLTEDGFKEVTVRHQDGYYYSDKTTEVHEEEWFNLRKG